MRATKIVVLKNRPEKKEGSIKVGNNNNNTFHSGGVASRGRNFEGGRQLQWPEGVKKLA